jgi:hypothetical protein
MSIEKDRKLLLFTLLMTTMLLIPSCELIANVYAPSAPYASLTITSYTATGHWTQTFPWTIEKSASPDTLTLDNGQSGSSTWTISVTKLSGVDDIWVGGQVCVSNGGTGSTEGLLITDDVYYQDSAVPGGFVFLTSGGVDLGADTSIAAGATTCYDYEVHWSTPLVSQSPTGHIEYKNTINVSISNAPAPAGTTGPKTYSTSNSSWSIPATPTLINNEIDVTDTNGHSYHFSASGSVSYDQTFACPQDAGTHTNTATITQTGQPDDATVTVTCNVAAGCTYSMGYYWQQHQESIDPLLPISLGSLEVTTRAQAVAILGIPDASNGIDKLYAQLLTAKLNINNGADDSAVASVISAADSFLSTHTSADWNTLSSAEHDAVLSWMGTLDDYNNGVIGPGHC